MNDKLISAAEMALEVLGEVSIEYDFHGNPVDVRLAYQLEATLKALRQALKENKDD